MRGQYRKDAAFFIALHGKMDIAYGCRKNFGSQTWTGIARPNNPFYERSVRDSLALFSLR